MARTYIMIAQYKEAKVRRKPPTQNLGSKTTEGEKAAIRLIFARPNRVHLRPDLAAFRNRGKVLPDIT